MTIIGVGVTDVLSPPFFLLTQENTLFKCMHFFSLFLTPFFFLPTIAHSPSQGDERAGKSLLLHRLQGKKQATDDNLKGTGVEFSYLDIKEEETEGEKWEGGRERERERKGNLW